MDLVSEYKQAAKQYTPDKIKILFIAESPPYAKDGKEKRYFYFENMAGKDFLFKSIMDVLFPEDYQKLKEQKLTKKDLLSKFCKSGYFLVDACEQPINQHEDEIRNKQITDNFVNLLGRLNSLKEMCRETKIIIIKKNVYVLLSDGLKQTYFVLNKEYLPFPSCGQQKKFREKLRDLLKNQHTSQFF